MNRWTELFFSSIKCRRDSDMQGDRQAPDIGHISAAGTMQDNSVVHFLYILLAVEVSFWCVQWSRTGVQLRNSTT